MQAEIEDLLARSGGVLRRADHPGLAKRLDRLRARGELSSPLPGILWRPESAESFEVRILAGQLWAGPTAVLTGRAAARLTFWPGAPVSELTFVGKRRQHVRRAPWELRPGTVPPEHIQRRGPLNFTAPALTAVDLAAEPDGGDIIDRALRSHRRTGVTLDELWRAFHSMPKRTGNPVRAAILHDSRDNPWSEGERRLHRLLRSARITGWRTNAKLIISGQTYYADVLFRGRRLILEFDGWEFHSDRGSFERDRHRRNELQLAGYLVLNFTWRQLEDRPDWVLGCIKRALGNR